MGTYSNRNYIIPEGGASASHFSWYNPGGFVPAPKTSCRPPPGTQFNPEPCLNVPPIRTVSPTTQSVLYHSSEMKVTKAKKKKTSVAGLNKKSSKALKPKELKNSVKPKKQSIPGARHERKNLNIQIDQMGIDFSGVPSPFCSCTGTPRLCYKWGAGGWQSSCCNTNVSEYPLPMSPTRQGARVAGRKMSNGAYSKLLLKLSAEGHDLSNPLDLKDHWARHGTNKFVTIK